jgi:transcriptional regulator with PAS, ATPase and Fis domain
MMVLAEGDILTERDLPERIAEGSLVPTNPKEIPAGVTMEELERLAITKALDQYAGNRTHAANRLGISVRRCSESCGNMSWRNELSRFLPTF